jgi:hypothetical protein
MLRNTAKLRGQPFLNRRLLVVLPVKMNQKCRPITSDVHRMGLQSVSYDKVMALSVTWRF